MTAAQRIRPHLPLAALLAAHIARAGYNLHPRQLEAGEKLAVTLYWQALRSPGRDYRISVQVRDGDRVVAQSDAAPTRETQPTRSWQAG